MGDIVYNLGDHFKNKDIDKLQANPSCVFKGNNYRITVLTERLVRLEYDPNGIFNNNETVIVKNRFFDMPDFNKKEDETLFVIETRYFSLTYVKGSMFNSRTLTAKYNDSKVGWYYGNKEVRNFKSCNVSLDNQREKPSLLNGLFSEDGIATIDDSNNLCFDEESNVILRDYNIKNHIDIYLFVYGKDFGLCLLDYFKLTGKPPLIPRYALGNWWSREYDYKDSDVINLIEKFERKNIPIAVFLLDNGWENKKNNEKYGFTFNKELFPNPLDFINKVHEKNVKIGVKINPQYGFSNSEQYYEEAKKYIMPDKNGIIPFNPYDMKSIDIFLKIFKTPLESMGVDILWNDYFDSDKNKMYLVNYYMNKDNLKYNKRHILLSRNSTYDAHLFNVLYSGKTLINWNTLKMLPFYNLNSANIGVSFWSHDVGGSVGGIEDSDLYLRSIEFGVFSPIFRFNTEKGKYFKREPWKWDVVTESIATSYLQLRHKLIPYLYSEAYNYAKNGTPIIRPFYYNNLIFYDDENYVNQYYFGSAFMISPIINPMDEMISGRTVQKFYMPSGVWYDFKNSKRFLGNHKYVAFYSIADYPIFVKQGSIIPLQGEDSYMDYSNPKTLEIHVFPGESNTYKLYEDDGETLDYQNGKYLITELDYNYRASNYTLIIRPIEGDMSVIPEKRNYKVVFRNTRAADKLVVMKNDEELSNVRTESTETEFIVYLDDIETKCQLVINCYGEDIEIDSVKLIKDDIEGIISDLKINTVLKDDVAAIMFNDSLSLGKKRIAIRKLKRKGLDSRSVKIFLRLLEYMEM